VKITVVYKVGNNKAEALAGEVTSYIEGKGSEVLKNQTPNGADYILSLGGDGTLIHKACEYAEFGIPILGINTGNLGFLTAVEAVDWKTAVDKILKGEIFISERITLFVEAGREQYRAVNEAAIKGLYRVVELAVGAKGEELLRVSGDGVIIASQSGSTAYSLSAGGPIVDSDLDSILVTPINPIGLPIPSIVLSPNDPIEVEVKKGTDVSLIIDGQEHKKLNQEEVVRVSRGKHKVKFAYLSKHQFLKALNAKFGLGRRSSI